jgi:hypothetical protein
LMCLRSTVHVAGPKEVVPADRELTPSLHRVLVRDSSVGVRLRKCKSKVVEG